MNENTCQEKTGLFLIDVCDKQADYNCKNCSKSICKKHLFTDDETATKLCLSCKAVLDKRLTSEIELYSSDRAVWRKKMGSRFLVEYPYLVAMADQYDALFHARGFSDSHYYAHGTSAFDS
jgi:hypothetical protein